jgi:hypothetical protein
MISTAYHQQCETLCFAWRNDTPRLRALRFVGAEKRNGFGLISGSVAKGGASPGTLREALPAPGPKSFFEPVRGASDRACGRDSKEGKKLREGAITPLESLGRVNLCAPHSRFITARSLRWVRPRPRHGRLRARGRPSRSARAPRDPRPSPGVRPALASARH